MDLMWYVRERAESRITARFLAKTTKWIIVSFYCVGKTGHLGARIEFYFGYVISELLVGLASRFQVGIWIYKFKLKREAKPRDLNKEYSSISVVILP